VERGHELRQRGHLDAGGDEGADAAADRQPEQDQPDAAGIDTGLQQGRQHGDRHADHAVEVALPAGFGVREPAQGQDEQHRRDQVGDGGEGGSHRLRPSSCR
jgi:hypothetical protein